MQAIKVGDKVSVLNDKIIGTVLKINLKKCVIKDTDDFERIYKISDLVLCKSLSDYNLPKHIDNKHIVTKINVEKKQSSKSVKKKTKKNKLKSDTLVIDLHIHELVNDYSNMCNYDIVQKQMQTCRITLEKALHLKLKKVVLIHGKGKGVLRNEIYTYLHRFENTKHIKLEINDASYTEFGMGGATEVIFK